MKENSLTERVQARMDKERLRKKKELFIDSKINEALFLKIIENKHPTECINIDNRSYVLKWAKIYLQDPKFQNKLTYDDLKKLKKISTIYNLDNKIHVFF